MNRPGVGDALQERRFGGGRRRTRRAAQFAQLPLPDSLNDTLVPVQQAQRDPAGVG